MGVGDRGEGMRWMRENARARRHQSPCGATRARTAFEDMLFDGARQPSQHPTRRVHKTSMRLGRPGAVGSSDGAERGGRPKYVGEHVR